MVWGSWPVCWKLLGINKLRKVTTRSGNMEGSKRGGGRKCEILLGNRKGTHSRGGSISVLGHGATPGNLLSTVSWENGQRIAPNFLYAM